MNKLCCALAALTAVAAPPVAAQTLDPDKVPYVVEDGKVDPHTYNGYRRYHAACHVCHGPDGLGSSFAPALAESLKRLGYYDFIDVVVNGRANMGATGDRVMPSFGTDPNVMSHVDDIYTYLKARADGVLPPGRPQRMAPAQVQAQPPGGPETQAGSSSDPGAGAASGGTPQGASPRNGASGQ